MHPKVAHARAMLGVEHRRRDASPEAIAEARRELAAAKLEDYITRTVDAAPPLTPEQRERLAALLRGGGRNA